MCSILADNRVRISCLFQFQGDRVLALPHDHGQVELIIVELLMGCRLNSYSTQTSTDRSQETIPNLVSPSGCVLGSNDGGPQIGRGSTINENSAKGFVAKLHQIGSHSRQTLKGSDGRDPGFSTVQQSTFHKVACIRNLTNKLPTVEDFKAGYPRFAALVGSHPSFHVCRRFSRLRARLLLIKQDELSSLETQLDEVDRQETRLLFLGSRRLDKNGERLELIAKIDGALSDYGMFEICGIVSC